MTKIRFGLVSTVLLFFATSGCGPSGPPPSPPNAPFLTITNITDDTPEIGSTVRVKWEYGEDVNPNNVPKLKNQVVQMISMTIDGSAFRETRGCFPEGFYFLYGEAPGECIANSEREFEFTFNGPVMFRLVAFSDRDTIGEFGEYEVRAIRFTQPDMEFKVSVNPIQDDRYPGNFGPTGNILFERAFGIYEVATKGGDEDGIIDEFGPGTELGQLFPTVFDTLDGQHLTPKVYGTSTKKEEADHFGFLKGGNFPLLQPSFLETPNAQTFRDTKTHADIVIFGGSLQFDGQQVATVKTDAGGNAPVMTSSNTSVLIVQIDVRSAPTDPPQWVIADLHVCNPSQGLVLSTYEGSQANGPAPSLGQNSVTVDTSHKTSGGTIKGAITGLDIITTGGTPFQPVQARVDVDWSNIPLFPDNDLSGLKNTYMRFIR